MAAHAHGAFLVPDRAMPRLTPPSPKIATGSWVSQGYPFFAGEGSYARKVTLPSCATNQRWMLDLGEIASAGRVAVDGREIGVRIAPPWTFDLTPYAEKTIELTVRVANTPHNLFMQEALTAGLLGPVTLKKVGNSL